MSKCDTMRPGDVLRLRDREGELADIVVTIRAVDDVRHLVRIGTDADQRWMITQLPAGRRESDS